MRTDDKIRAKAVELAGIDVDDESWHTAVKMTLEDIYANCICMDRSVSVEYFITVLVRSMRLVSRLSQGMKV